MNVVMVALDVAYNVLCSNMYLWFGEVSIAAGGDWQKLVIGTRQGGMTVIMDMVYSFVLVNPKVLHCIELNPQNDPFV